MFDLSLCEKYLRVGGKFAALAAAACESDAFLRYFALLRQAAQNENAADAERVCRAARAYCSAFEPQHEHMITATLIASLLPFTIEKMRAGGCSERTISDTLGDFSVWAEKYERESGVPGANELPWLLYPHCGRLFRLGRLQFECCPFVYPYYVFSNAHGSPLALCEAGLSVDSSGHIVGTNGSGRKEAFKTTLSCDGETLRGFFADGVSSVIKPAPEAIALSEHELLLSPMQRVLNIHIPEGEPLSEQSVGDSLKSAREFFSKREYPCELAICESWLLDPALFSILPPESKILAFSSRFVKMPVFSESASAEKYLLAPRETGKKSSLQCGLESFLSRGGECFDTAGVLML